MSIKRKLIVSLIPFAAWSIFGVYELIVCLILLPILPIAHKIGALLFRFRVNESELLNDISSPVRMIPRSAHVSQQPRQNRPPNTVINVTPEQEQTDFDQSPYV